MSQEHNPFDDSSFDSQQIDDDSSQNTFPVSLDRQHCDGANTPISRFSELTSQTDIKTVSENKIEMVSAQQQQQIGLESDLKAYVQILEKRNQEMAVALEKEKIKNQHIEQALTLIQREDSSLLKKLEQQTRKASILEEELAKEETKVTMITSKYEHSKAEVSYLKELILLANNNYEELQRKYSEALDRCRRAEEEQAHRERQMSSNVLEMKNILTNIISSPKGNSENSSNQQNRRPQYGSLRSPKQDPDQVYRKMFLRTLKVRK